MKHCPSCNQTYAESETFCGVDGTRLVVDPPPPPPPESFFFYCYGVPRDLHSFPTRRSSDLAPRRSRGRPPPRRPPAPAPRRGLQSRRGSRPPARARVRRRGQPARRRRGAVSRSRCRVRGSEEHTSELQSLRHLVCRLLLEKK